MVVWRAVGDEVLHATDGTAYTMEQIHERVSTLDDGIVFIREVPNGTDELWKALAKRGEEVGRQFDSYCWIVDIRQVNVRPKGRYLEAVRATMEASGARRVICVVPAGSMMRTVAKFVVGFMIKKVTFAGSAEEALGLARKALHA